MIVLCNACCKKTIISSEAKNADTKESTKPSDFQKKVIKNKDILCGGSIFNPAKHGRDELIPIVSCISHGIFTGIDSMEDKYIQILNCGIDWIAEWESTSNLMYSKPRGKRLFEEVLKVGNNFKCFRDNYLSEDGKSAAIRPIHEFFFDCYTSMIRSIDGMSVKDYLEKNDPYTMAKLDQFHNDKCNESEYKRRYIIIKQAYEKGLVVLKEYGEE